ncbi:MAG: hypothetical protein K6F97_12385 [Lachnospiraceae bacterium]|nr:hypothetical protein [Lachnospiraceae bacterium]
MPSREVIKKYEEVRSSLEKAIKKSDDIEISGEEENAELDYIRKTLNQLNSEFKTEIDRLENSSEWDRFCMAFFGETNAGKSTIIEALRIVYDEESRREEINSQNDMIKSALSEEEKDYSELVRELARLNTSLEVKKESNVKKALIGSGLIVLGVILGFLIAFLVL